MRSIEQICRDVLTEAINEGLVFPTTVVLFDDPDPQARSSGELVGVANVLHEALLENSEQIIIEREKRDE